MEKQENNKKSIASIVENIIYVCVLVPLIVITISIVFQLIVYPKKIPHIFGYKIFMIFDKYMDDSVEYGDLVVTRNIEANKLKTGNTIAFRNNMNTVTIHKIINIEEETLIMNTLKNETLDTKKVKKEKVEGILVYRIPKLGEIIYYIQQPWAIIAIGSIILIIGLIWIYIAQELDEKEKRQLEQKNMQEQEDKKEEEQEEKTKQLI